MANLSHVHLASFPPLAGKKKKNFLFYLWKAYSCHHDAFFATLVFYKDYSLSNLALDLQNQVCRIKSNSQRQHFFLILFHTTQKCFNFRLLPLSRIFLSLLKSLKPRISLIPLSVCHPNLEESANRMFLVLLEWCGKGRGKWGFFFQIRDLISKYFSATEV